jgi:nucleotide-binding universal stress UspA family protein
MSEAATENDAMPLKPKNLLWPTDFSALSLKAAKYAREFARAFEASLHILHVVPPPVSPDVTVIMPAPVALSVPEPEILDASMTALKRIVDEHFGGDESIRVTAQVGNPWWTICEYTRKNEIDLIIIGTHGHTGLRHMLLGSTAEQVVRHACCPVLTVKLDENDFVE